MSIHSITIADATPAQRRQFVTQFLNLDLGADASDDQVLAAIKRAQPNSDVIFALDEPEEEQKPAVAPPRSEADPIPEELLRPEERAGRQAGSLGKDDPRWLINIPIVETEDGSGSRDVILGVNGRGWQLKRGHDINIPHRVKVALDNAVQTIIRHERDGQGDVNEVRHRAKRFPYQVLEMPTKAEIEAWDKRVGPQFCA